MTKIINKSFLIIAVVFAMALTGCLKDKDYTDNLVGTKNTQNQNLVEVHLTSSDNTNYVKRSYDAINRDSTITKLIPINLTSGPASSDVTVTFQVLDEASSPIIDSLVNIEGLIIPDPAAYVIQNANNQVTIPAGSQTAYISVKFKPADFIGDTYIFGIKLTAVSNSNYTLSNLVYGYVQFGIKNMYDGNYTLTGTMVDLANSAFKGAYPLNVYLITQSGNSVALWDIDIWGNYFHTFMNGSSYSGYGSFSPVFIFDANNNVTSVVNIYGQPASNGRSAQLDPSGVNKFDPVTKTLKVKYWLNQPAVIAPHRTTFDETFTYEGPR
jgi:hypothetical protein